MLIAAAAIILSPRLGLHQDETISSMADLRIQCQKTTGGGHDKVELVGTYQVIDYNGAPSGSPVAISMGPIDINDRGNADERSVTRVGFTRLALKRGQCVTMYLSLLANSDGDWLSHNGPGIASKLAQAVASYYLGPAAGSAAAGITQDTLNNLLTDSGTHFLGSLWAVGAPPITEPNKDIMFFVFPADSGTKYIGPGATGIIPPEEPQVTKINDDLYIRDFPGAGTGMQLDFSSDSRARYSLFFSLENGRIRVETHGNGKHYSPRGWAPNHGPMIQAGFS